LRHDPPALLVGEDDPLRDFIERSTAADANPVGWSTQMRVQGVSMLAMVSLSGNREAP